MWKEHVRLWDLEIEKDAVKVSLKLQENFARVGLRLFGEGVETICTKSW